MAIAFDATATSGPSFTAATSVTWSHTQTGSNLMLHVAGFENSATAHDSGCTYATVPLTKYDTSTVRPDGIMIITGWLLAGGATGANNIVLSFASSQTILGHSASYTGVNQSDTPDSNNKGTNTGINLTISTTTVADNCWGILSASSDGTAVAAGTNSTQRQTTGSGSTGLFDTNAAQTPAGSVSMQATGTVNLTGLIVSIAPSGAVVTTTRDARPLMLLGVG